MQENASIAPIVVYGAGAGTGKTFTLASEFVNAVRGAGRFKQLISPGRIIATTFTNYAANELACRVRSALISQGLYDQADEVHCGYIGTVNAICGRLVDEFGMYAGLPPATEVIPEDRTAFVFRASAESAIRTHEHDLRVCADRLGIEDWPDVIFTIAQSARVNLVAAEDLIHGANHSWTDFRELLCGLDPADGDLNQQLLASLSVAQNQLRQQSDGKKVTSDAIRVVDESVRTFKFSGFLPWQSWARLSKLKASSNLDCLLSAVRSVAKNHIRHPQLRDDVAKFIQCGFNCAAEAMLQYDEYKRQRGLLDFVDQERLCLELLTDESAHQILSNQFAVLLVDEFQDTSPLQLSIFLKLAKLVDHSVWVGDEKQAIFGFRGSAPELMDAASTTIVRATGGERIQHTVNYRSRAELVSFVDDIFENAMVSAGVTSNTTKLSANREQATGTGAALKFWWLGSGDWSQNLSALAERIRQWIDQPGVNTVWDDQIGQWRNPRGSDIAILCRSNDRRAQVARALTERGISVDTERSGLMRRNEIVLTLAAFRYLIDRADTLALMELVRFFAPADWLSKALLQGVQAVASDNLQIQTIDRARSKIKHLTPREVLELAIECGGILESFDSDEPINQALANLDKVRGAARQFEDRCRAEKSSCSAPGLLRYLQAELFDANQPGVGTPDAVRILTYHKSKGLEWPIVILLDLQNADQPDSFGVRVIESNSDFNISNPLEGRSIRLWPWPYGKQRKDVIIDELVAHSSVGKVDQERSDAERIRLLYVGMTRARDYLVFASKSTPSGWNWLKTLTDSTGKSLLRLEEGTSTILLPPEFKQSHFLEMESLDKGFRRDGNDVSCSTYLSQQRTEALKFQSFRLTASSAISADEPGVLTKWFEIGQRLDFDFGFAQDSFGDAMHQFLALCLNSDGIGGTDQSKLLDLLRRFGIAETNAPNFLTAVQRCERFIKRQYGNASVRTEVPVHGRLDSQRISGFVDLLIETSDHFAIMDHKTFPGGNSHLERRVREYAKQLSVYKQVIDGAGRKPVRDMWIHMPVLGRMCLLSVVPNDK